MSEAFTGTCPTCGQAALENLPALTGEEMAVLRQALAVAESNYREIETATSCPGLLRDAWRQRAIDARTLRKRLGFI